MPITTLPPNPDPYDPGTFAAKSAALLGALAQFVSEANALQVDVNMNAAAASTAQSMRDAAQAAANYKGVWSALTGALNIPASVFHNNNFWILTSNLANVATAEPGAGGVWAPVNGFRTPLPTIRPSLLLNFANSQAVDPRITFTRASTATKYSKSGVLSLVQANVPRIDYDPVTLECKGLLIEEARTNLLTYSEQFDNAAWGKTRATVTANATTSPDGTVNADRLTEDASGATDHYLDQGYAGFTAGTTYTMSVFAKADSRSMLTLWIPASVFSDNSTRTADFNLAAGTVGAIAGSGVTSSITPVGNGWYRCAMIFTVTLTIGTNALIRLHNGISSFYTGDGVSGLYIWGGDLEAGSFLTSYIPTTSAQVTRAAESAVMSGANFSSWFRQGQGSLVIARTSARYPAVSPCDEVLLHDGTLNNLIQSRVVGDPAQQYTDSGVAAGGVAQADTANIATQPNTKNKSGLAWDANDIADTVNGLAVSVGSATIPVVNQLLIGNHGSVWFSSIDYYPARLSNATLQSLTAN